MVTGLSLAKGWKTWEVGVVAIFLERIDGN